MHNTLQDDIFEAIKSEISPKAFKTWFSGANIALNEEKLIIVTAENEFASDWIKQHYSSLIKTTAEKILYKEVEVKIISKNDEEVSNTISSLL
ncbi:DnaA N-terminal domain-containing protein [Metabacillus litoralis]|uniref:DnaA N-terminal domain-containing protein n=1 Tax=Metabacillus litoralis TaxID=152268 RepID=UPI001315945D|nr:DnaA N-terminal domain-containing protein [Metabacillus litoralis]